MEGGEALSQAAQRGFGCPIPVCVQGQFGWASGQLDLAGGSPAYSRSLKVVGGNQSMARGLD